MPSSWPFIAASIICWTGKLKKGLVHVFQLGLFIRHGVQTMCRMIGLGCRELKVEMVDDVGVLTWLAGWIYRELPKPRFFISSAD